MNVKVQCRRQKQDRTQNQDSKIASLVEVLQKVELINSTAQTSFTTLPHKVRFPHFSFSPYFVSYVGSLPFYILHEYLIDLRFLNFFNTLESVKRCNRSRAWRDNRAVRRFTPCFVFCCWCKKQKRCAKFDWGLIVLLRKRNFSSLTNNINIL